MSIYEDIHFLLMVGFDIPNCEMYIFSSVVVICCISMLIMCALLCDHPPTPFILEDRSNGRLEEIHL